jgi:hypothetical protein
MPRDFMGQSQSSLTHSCLCSHRDQKAIPTPTELLLEEDQVLLKRCIFALKRNSLPPITMHNMADDANNPDPEPDSLREAVQGQLRSWQDCVPSRLFEFK